MKTAFVFAFLAAVVLGGAHLRAQAPDGEWRHYAGDAASSHYSRLAQINKSNVARLRAAWEWKAGDRPRPRYGNQTGNQTGNQAGNNTEPTPFEATPLM
ncbi:MAG: hypothetical protein ACRD88_16115, partial [Terriglobia bacterium]